MRQSKITDMKLQGLTLEKARSLANGSRAFLITDWAPNDYCLIFTETQFIRWQDQFTRRFGDTGTLVYDPEFNCIDIKNNDYLQK